MSTKTNQIMKLAQNVEPLHQDEEKKLSGGFNIIEPTTNLTGNSEATNIGYCSGTTVEDTNIGVCMKH